MIKNLSSAKILGTTITTSSKEEILEYIVENASKRGSKIPIVTPNPEILMYALRHKTYQEVLNRAEIAIPDGIGVLISGRIMKNGIKGRIAGVDLMEDLCRQASERGLTVGFLGGRGTVAEKTALCLVKKYADLIVAFANDEWDEKKMRKNHIDILFVAFGFPKQEEWIDENLKKIPVTVAMGVGGAFDYLSGKVRRAPMFIRSLGMEWAFRLMIEPWRIKRQTALPRFAFEVLKERLFTSK